jgi:hypothetical protein
MYAMDYGEAERTVIVRLAREKGIDLTLIDIETLEPGQTFDKIWLNESASFPTQALLNANTEPQMAGNHRAVAGTKKARQLNVITGKHTTSHADSQGERQVERGQKFFMGVSLTNGQPIVQTRSRKAMYWLL